MDAYIYQADIYCRDCGEAIASGIDASEFDLIAAEDSDCYPQGPYADGGGEADSIQYCAHCHVDLDNPVIGGRWFDKYGNVLRTIPEEAVSACTVGGQDASDPVAYWVETLNFDGPADAIRDYLREFGAWDDEQLSDWRENLHRLFWIFCGDLKEDPDTYLSLSH
jgi:hypothetical protein